MSQRPRTQKDETQEQENKDRLGGKDSLDDKSSITEILSKKLGTDTTQPEEIDKLEQQIIHSQKMESLGELASGIAHDFNNILGGIMGYTSLLKSKLDPKTDSYEYAQFIEIATQRGTEITRQILEASNKTNFQTSPININEIVEEVATIMAHALPKEVQIKTNLENKLQDIQGDYSQIHQVLMNLCINASDAMPKGGKITIKTENITIKRELLKENPNLSPGQHIKLSISDTGTGIKSSIKDKIFEPFFTTKQPNKGTGLGLAIVKNILENHNSIITAESSGKRGSTFTIYFPLQQ